MNVGQLGKEERCGIEGSGVTGWAKRHAQQCCKAKHEAGSPTMGAEEAGRGHSKPSTYHLGDASDGMTTGRREAWGQLRPIPYRIPEKGR